MGTTRRQGPQGRTPRRLRWTHRLAALTMPLCAIALVACSDPAPTADEDLGPIDDTLEFGDRINWPGLDQAEGRVIPFIVGFGNDRSAAYWFLGFAAKKTADSFWFCRESDESCPIDEHHRLDWDHLVGHPIFTRIPGGSEFSPFWQMWKVTVPDDYEPDTIKTVETLRAMESRGDLTVEPFIIDFGTLQGDVVGPQEVVLHCALVLQGTTLANNGGRMPDDSGDILELKRNFGWHNGYRVEFIDFSPSDGVFPEGTDSESRPNMPFANIYIQWKECDGDPRPAICDLPGYAYDDQRPVSERGLGQDITDDGDSDDTNNVMGALPCERIRPEEKRYSPLWAVNKVVVPASFGMSLMDDYGEQTQSDIMGATTLFEDVEAGLVAEPEPQMEDSTGNPVPGNEGQIFFNCPNPVRTDYVPFPCTE